LDLLPTFSGFAAGAPAIASVANESPETSVGYASCVAEALAGWVLLNDVCRPMLRMRSESRPRKLGEGLWAGVVSMLPIRLQGGHA
jgi:hypothetical protein